MRSLGNWSLCTSPFNEDYIPVNEHLGNHRIYAFSAWLHTHTQPSPHLSQHQEMKNSHFWLGKQDLDVLWTVESTIHLHF